VLSGNTQRIASQRTRARGEKENVMDNVVLGRLCQDPVLRQPRRAGQPVATFTVAVNQWRKVDREVVQRTPVFHRVVCYGPLAENVSNSLRKGMEVLAVGEWVDDSYSDATGQRRVQVAMEARAVGPALRYATAQVQKVERRTTNGVLFEPTPTGTATEPTKPARATSDPPAGEPPVGEPPVAEPTKPAASEGRHALVPTRGKHALATKEADMVAAAG
jgi:single-strand DNA-binding protein